MRIISVVLAQCLIFSRSYQKRHMATRGLELIIPKLTIMGNVRRHHEKAIRADACCHPAVFRAGVDARILANGCFGTDAEGARLVVISHVLGSLTD